MDRHRPKLMLVGAAVAVVSGGILLFTHDLRVVWGVVAGLWWMVQAATGLLLDDD